MPKINVYLPDDLADAVREAGLPVSPICQRALEHALRRLATIRQAVAGDFDPATAGGFTDRLTRVLNLAADRAKAGDAASVGTGDLLHALVAEQGNLALQILTALEVDPQSLDAPDTIEPATATDALRFSRPAASVLEIAVGEAIGLGHNYVGCEHLLIGLATEPDGVAGQVLRSRGVDGKAARRAVAAALAGYSHLRANSGGPAPTGLLVALRAELAPIVERIERLEAQVGG